MHFWDKENQVRTLFPRSLVMYLQKFAGSTKTRILSITMSVFVEEFKGFLRFLAIRVGAVECKVFIRTVVAVE